MSENVVNGATRTVSQKTLRKSAWTWIKYCLGVFGFERLEAPGFALSMLPIFEELYPDDKEKQIEGLKRHTKFYNTHPYLGGMINGIVASMEVERANGADITDEMIDDLKVGMMGPVAGIGDSLFQATLYPIIFSIAIGLAAGGSPLGAIFTVLAVNLLNMCSGMFTFFQGYKLGKKSFDLLVGAQMQKIQAALGVLGMTVMGAITASFVKFNLTIKYVSDVNEIDIQGVLDGMFPKLLPIALVMLGLFLLKKKHFNAIQLILTYLVIAVVCVLLGII